MPRAVVLAAAYSSEAQRAPSRLPRLIHRTGPVPKVSSAQPPLLFLLGQEVSARCFFPVAANLAIFHRIAVLQKKPLLIMHLITSQPCIGSK